MNFTCFEARFGPDSNPEPKAPTLKPFLAGALGGAGDLGSSAVVTEKVAIL